MLQGRFLKILFKYFSPRNVPNVINESDKERQVEQDLNETAVPEFDDPESCKSLQDSKFDIH